MSLLFASVMSPPPLPRLAAICFQYAQGAGASHGLMVPNATNTKLDYPAMSGIPAGTTQQYDLVISEPAIASIEPFDWPPPECCEEIAIVLGTPLAFEDDEADRLPWGVPTLGMKMSTELTITYDGAGLLTIKSPSGVGVHTFDVSKRAQPGGTAMGVYVCLRARGSDKKAAIKHKSSGATATFIG